MELTVAKTDLQKELQLCQGVVEKRSTIPILSNVLLKAADDTLQIAATDLDVTILSSCPAKITTPGGVTIEAKRLFDVVRSLPDEDVRVTMQENNSMLIESGTADSDGHRVLYRTDRRAEDDGREGEICDHARGDTLPAQWRAAESSILE